jgi:hypothetical protein
VLEVSGKPEAAEAALGDVMKRSARGWKIEAETVERALVVVEQTLHLVQDGRLADGPITIKIAYDEVTLTVMLEYRGDLLTTPAHRPVTEENLVEEQPFVKGLSGFLIGVYPDRVRTSADDGRCRVVLVFDV